MSVFEVNYFDQDGVLRQTETSDPGWFENAGKWINPDIKLAFRANLSETSAGSRYTIHTIEEHGPNRIAALTFITGFIRAVEGEKAELILPCDIGVSCCCSGKEEAEYLLPGFSAPKWPPFVMNMLMNLELFNLQSHRVY
ncbi:MAG: hypothetical protein EOM73_16050 [Bacteroidia bacterium]|nr:hypothetical protein [Bacteroidia bacterium]